MSVSLSEIIFTCDHWLNYTQMVNLIFHVSSQLISSPNSHQLVLISLMASIKIQNRNLKTHRRFYDLFVLNGCNRLVHLWMGDHFFFFYFLFLFILNACQTKKTSSFVEAAKWLNDNSFLIRFCLIF